MTVFGPNIGRAFAGGKPTRIEPKSNPHNPAHPGPLTRSSVFSYLLSNSKPTPPPFPGTLDKAKAPAAKHLSLSTLAVEDAAAAGRRCRTSEDQARRTSPTLTRSSSSTSPSVTLSPSPVPTPFVSVTLRLSLSTPRAVLFRRDYGR